MCWALLQKPATPGLLRYRGRRDSCPANQQCRECAKCYGTGEVRTAEKIDEIIAVDGIDVVFVGPYDLSQSLGVTGQVDHPMVTDRMVEIVQKCLPKGIAVGSFVETVEGARKRRDLGVKYLYYSVDTGIFSQACHDIVAQTRRVKFCKEMPSGKHPVLRTRRRRQGMN
jgi:HpcH/HpaI aldolase/citrate lyase family